MGSVVVPRRSSARAGAGDCQTRGVPRGDLGQAWLGGCTERCPARDQRHDRLNVVLPAGRSTTRTNSGRMAIDQNYSLRNADLRDGGRDAVRSHRVRGSCPHPTVVQGGNPDAIQTADSDAGRGVRLDCGTRVARVPVSMRLLTGVRGANPDGPYWFSPAQLAGSVDLCVGIASGAAEFTTRSESSRHPVSPRLAPTLRRGPTGVSQLLPPLQPFSNP